MIVRLERDWKQYTAGDIITEEDRPAYVLNRIVANGWATDITHDAEREPTMEDYKEDIQKYLDSLGIAYTESMTKRELLDQLE